MGDISNGIGPAVKALSAKWSAMTAEEKAEYNARAEELTAERMAAAAAEASEESEGEKKRGKRVKKDPLAPKRPLSAFLLYSGDRAERVRAAHPNTSYPEVMKMLGTEWQTLSAAKKQVHKDHR